MDEDRVAELTTRIDALRTAQDEHRAAISALAAQAAEAAAELVTVCGSQRAVAEVLHVSEGRVSQLLAASRRAA
jgi:hypothetical protein